MEKCEEAARSTSSESDTTLPARSSRLSAERRAMVCQRPTREKHTGGYDAPLLGPCKVVNEVHQHCVRATVVTDLKDAGFSNHEV